MKALLSARPFASPIDLNKLLLSQKLTPEQTQAFYRSAFVHINLNTATGEEIMLIPGAGKRMAHEFEEYRPWKAWAQFDKEIGKYVNAQEVARLAQYGFIPMDPNTASDADLQSIPGVGPAHAARTQGVPAMEIAGPLRQGDRQVRRPERGGATGPLPDAAMTRVLLM